MLIGASAAGFAVGLATIALFVGAANRYVVVVLPWLAILAAPLVAAMVNRVRRSRLGAGPGAGPGEGRAWRDGGAWLVAVVLAIALAAQGVASHRAWMASGTRDLVAIQDRVARLVAPGSVIAGGYGPLLAMTAQATTIVPSAAPARSMRAIGRRRHPQAACPGGG